jgi:hypothetical protein
MATTEQYTHPSDLTPEQRRENTAQLHDRFARAFAKVGNQKDAAAAKRLAKVARDA